MSYLYNTFFFKPLFNALIFLYGTVAFHDLGLAIIFLTVAVRLILFPLFQKSIRHQIIMQALQPKIKKIQDEHKKDLQKQSQAMMALYKEHEINPFSGFFLLLIQLPILIALYQIFLRSLSSETFKNLYGFVHHPPSFNTSFLGLINLQNHSIIMVFLAAIAQYFQGRLSLSPKQANTKPSSAERMSRNMVFIAPVITVIIFINFPAALGLYWITTSVFSIIQQLIVNKQLANGKLGSIYQKTD